MKTILTTILLLLLFGNHSKAQDCTGYVPPDAVINCDTDYTINANNGRYWMAHDSTYVRINGDSNIVYLTCPSGGVGINGNYNTIYASGNCYAMLIQTTKHNTIYMQSGFVYLFSDSNTIYSNNLRVVANGNNNAIYCDSITQFSNTGVNNAIYPSACSEIQIYQLHLPPNPCNQTTGLGGETVDISVFPNPATDIVTFNLHNAGQVQVITLYDIAGKTVEVLANITTDKVMFNTAALGTGLYVYSITLANGKTQHGKLLVRS